MKVGRLHTKIRTLQVVTALLAVVLVSCGPKKGYVRIKGTIEKLPKASFYVYTENPNGNVFDTIHVNNGKFEYETALPEKQILTLQYPNFSRTYIIAEPGKTISIKADPNNLQTIDVSGTEENEHLTEFRLKNANRPENDRILAASQYIRDHAGALESVILFKRYFANAEHPNPRQTLELLDILEKAQPECKDLSYMASYMRPRLENASGMPIYHFEGRGIKGEPIRFEDYKGTPLLIVAWATWLPSSLDGVHQAISYLASQNKALKLVTVNLDTEKSRCENATQYMSSIPPIIFDGKAFESPIVKGLGIEHLPTFILVDKGGKVITRNIHTNRLAEEIDRYLH